VLESQLANVCPGEGGNQELHLERQRRARAREGQMGHVSAPDPTRGTGYHRPKDSIRSPAGQAVGQRSCLGWGALEGVGQAQSRPDQTPRSRKKAPAPPTSISFSPLPSSRGSTAQCGKV